MTRRGSIPTRTLLLLAAGIIVGLVMMETVLRLARISYPVFHRPDGLLGAWHREGVSGWQIREGVAWVEINEAGMRDREHAVEKPVGTFRIAVLGDSFAEALQVSADQTFWAVIERELGWCPHLDRGDVEVLNFGVSGFGTTQALLTLRHRAWAYSPDLVLLAFVSNDVRNNSRALERDPTRPYYSFERGELVLEEPPRRWHARQHRWYRRLRRRLSDYSYVVQLLGEVRGVLRRREMAAREIKVGGTIHSPPRDRAWEEAWRITEAVVTRTAREVAERGSMFLLVLTTDGHQVHPDPEFRRRFEESVGSDDLFYPERRMISVADREGFAALGLAADLQRHAETHGVCLHGFDNASPCGGHWNAEGHRVAGELAARRICRMLSSESGNKGDSSTRAIE